MKRSLLMMCAVLALSTSVVAQTRENGGATQQEIDGVIRTAQRAPTPLEPGASQTDVNRAVLAAPERLRNQVMVIKWNPADWTYVTLRKGTVLVCFDKSGLPGQLPYSIECTHIGNLPRAAQNMRLESEPDRAKSVAAINAAEKDGTRIKPVYGSAWYHLFGADAATAIRHLNIALPFATGASTGFPERGTDGLFWLMNAGTSSAHLMTPGE